MMGDLAKLLGVSVDDLTGASQTATAKGSVLRVPILGRIPAGVPLEMIEDVEGYEEIPWRPGEFFGLRVRGSSMAPAIQDGDLVILKKQEDVENGQIAAVSIGGEDATLKKVQKVDGHVVLLPLNPAYDPMLFPASSVRILGLLVESKRVWA
jgi:repressor LexA